MVLQILIYIYFIIFIIDILIFDINIVCPKSLVLFQSGYSTPQLRSIIQLVIVVNQLSPKKEDIYIWFNLLLKKNYKSICINFFCSRKSKEKVYMIHTV